MFLYVKGRNGIGALTEMDGVAVAETIRITRGMLGATEEARDDAGLPAREMEKDVPLEIEDGGVEIDWGGAADQPKSAVTTAASAGSREFVAGSSVELCDGPAV